MNLRTKSRGFSLVELVIVVVIIGIIAAIAVPRISRGAKGAGDSALRGSLAGLRNAIDMYAAEHGGVFPAGTQTEIVDRLTKRTDAAGNVGTTAGTHIYGPYLRGGLPPLPIGVNKGDSDLIIDPATFAPSDATAGGWVYNTTTGEIIANSEGADESGKNYADY
jgi:prepilin-type N-terminal cleavage/methylation domain-containing protein